MDIPRAASSANNESNTNTGTRIEIEETRADEEIDNSSKEYLLGMQRVYRETAASRAAAVVPRRNHPSIARMHKELSGKGMSEVEATRISTIASMVSDEVINDPLAYTVRTFDAAIMFIDVSGFTELCQMYTKAGRGGPSKLTQVLNSYIGSMVQEILMKNGDVHKFSGDAFLAKWKSSSSLSMQDVVHAAIDCALLIQKNYGMKMTDVGVILRVKAAIAAGRTSFCILGDDSAAHYAAVGQPVWDCKMAEKFCVAGDVITSPSAWKYANETEYWTEFLPDGLHARILGVGAMWRRQESITQAEDEEEESSHLSDHELDDNTMSHSSHAPAVQLNYREFALRPAVLDAVYNSRLPELRRFMLSPVLRAVDNDEPMDHLSEVRRVVVVFANVICVPTTEVELLKKTDSAYKSVCFLANKHGGLLNKVNLFDKDLMLLVVFGLRGLKQDDEAQQALICAMEIRDTLMTIDGFISVSVGVTSGSTYCGVVGHILRREYTVIGPAVNKAARLMSYYPQKVTCDTDTFFNSKIDSHYFVLAEAKPLKGIPRPGPIYEYVKEKMRIQRTNERSFQEFVGRTDEMRLFRETLMPLIDQQKDRFNRESDYRQHSIVIIGPKTVGKSSMLDQCLNETPESVSTVKLNLSMNDKVPFGVIRLMFTKSLDVSENTSQSSLEQKIRASINVGSLSTLEVYALNVIFDCRLSVPESFSYSGELLTEATVKTLINNMCTSFFRNSWLFAIDDGQFIDDNSWTVLLLMIETGAILLLITVPSEDNLSTTGSSSIENDIFVKVQLSGLDRRYYAALACRALGVQAISRDLDTILQNFSGGRPGWIQDYVISIMENGWLEVQSMPGEKVLAAGAVVPFLERRVKGEIPSTSDVASNQKGNAQSPPQPELARGAKEDIKMAVLVDRYNIEDINVDGLLDAMILKTYDSLIPFEKLVVKCGSVLGNVFSRRMLEELLPSSETLLALAVKKLFEVDVLACQGGDFTGPKVLILIPPAPVPEQRVVETPHCFCLGIYRHDEHNLPSYAYCGYIRFQNPLFRSTTYELLTETQKGLDRTTSLQKSATERINNLCADALKLRDLEQSPSNLSRVFASRSAQTKTIEFPRDSTFSADSMDSQEENAFLHDSRNWVSRSNLNRVRSFSSLDMSRCECLCILKVAYPQCIHHARGAGEWTKLVESYIEFTYINILCSDIPQAKELLRQVEDFVMYNSEHYADLIAWQRDIVRGRIVSLRGACSLELGELAEARMLLMRAMELYACPFPSTTYSVRLRSTHASLKQMLMLSVPSLLVGTESGVVGDAYEKVANTLNYLHRLFMETKELKNAELAAKWALNLALRTNTNFRLLCECYANMLDITRHNKNFRRCRQLERRSLKLCRKRKRLEATELRGVNHLYTSLFCFYIASGKRDDGIAMGILTLRLFAGPTDLATKHTLLLGLSKLLLKALRVQRMVDVMQLLRTGDPSDISSEIWYYYMVMLVHLETGYSVEPFSVCEAFYLEKEDDLRASKASDAILNFIAIMWLMCVRLGQWETVTLWEQRLNSCLSERGFMTSGVDQLGIMFSMKLLEGRLVRLVQEMNNRNVRLIHALEETINRIVSYIGRSPILLEDSYPRFYLLNAYYNMIYDERKLALRWLARSLQAARQTLDEPAQIWSNHTLQHWLGTLAPELRSHWMEHANPDNLLSHHDFHHSAVVPYTLPLPSSLQET